MPYTPPAQLSPAASKQSSPTPSRSHSYIKGQFLSPELPASSGRPNLPRSHGSSSYLTKHRRSPSLNDTKEVLYNGESYQENGNIDPHGSLRQSPPPVNNSRIPAGMTISPPDSSHNSSDEEDLELRGRPRGLEVENLAALQAAIRSIEQRKSTGSPNRGSDKSTVESAHSVAPQTDRAVPTQTPQRPPLSQEARKISHSRSSTDSNIVFEPPHIPAPSSIRADTDDSDSDGGATDRPPMVRKKSGELVRPALRPSSRRRPSSMPGTPTYSKAVHFDSHLEHVRHFLQVDRPLAVSAGSSPVETYESESDFPFGSDENTARPRPSPYEWDMRLANFPPDSDARRASPIFVERIFLSADGKNLIGSVAVQNLAFQKFVVARFTLDYWKTTSEVGADYNNDARRKPNADGLDRFSFSIRLADQANLENKTLFFCVRYNVNGQEFWDNNGSFNYQVDFAKKTKAPPSKNAVSSLGARPLNALPRSRPSPPTSSGRPVSMPTSFDDFSTGFDNFGYSSSTGSLIGEPRLKLRSPRSKGELIPDAPQRRKASGSQAFGNRYDFNSSLTAAKNHAYAALGEHSGLSPRTDTKQSSHEFPATTPGKGVAIVPLKHEFPANRLKAGSNSTASESTPFTSKPAALMSEKPPLTSQSYQELVDKYCFFGTARSPEPLTKTALSMVDGAADSASDLSTGSSPRSSNASGSSTPTPPRSLSPVPDSQASKLYSRYIARSASPLSRSTNAFGSRSRSTVSFGYPFHTSGQHTLMSETPTPTAIQG